HRAPAQERLGRDRGEDHGPRRSAAARADHARSTRPRTRALRRRHVGAPAHLRRTRLRLVSPVALADEDLGRALDDVEGRVAVLALAEDVLAGVVPGEVEVLADLVDDLLAGLLGDSGEEREVFQQLGIGRDLELQPALVALAELGAIEAHFSGLRRASMARTRTSSWSRSSSPSGPLNSAGFAGAGAFAARAPERSRRSRIWALLPR